MAAYEEEDQAWMEAIDHALDALWEARGRVTGEYVASATDANMSPWATINDADGEDRRVATPIKQELTKFEDIPDTLGEMFGEGAMLLKVWEVVHET